MKILSIELSKWKHIVHTYDLIHFNVQVREELDIYTLQSEINNHLGLLGTEGGEKAQTAAFKGYALLKKISSLEKKDFVGKLDEEISQKLKVNITYY